jgi:glutaminyl-peptide cyclotransferase
MGVRTRRLLPLIAVLGVLAGCGDGRSAVPAAAAQLTVDRFDAGRAWVDLRRQVAIGPRPAGSPQLRALGRRLAARLPRGRLARIPGHPRLRNVVGRLPGTTPAVVVAAHYDTKDLPGFVGANDGAGGTAAVLELARVLSRTARPAGAPELRFVLFDGEESPGEADFYATGLRGSKAYAKQHAAGTRAVVLLDFVADRHLSIPREAGSDPALWDRLRAAARRVGAQRAFPDTVAGQVLDDHTPFTRRGVPAIDLIDFTYPCWHKACDDLEHVSQRSLDLAGETVLELLRSWR